MGWRGLALLLVTAGAAIAPAQAADIPVLAPLTWSPDDGVTLKLPFAANLIGFDSAQPGSAGMTGTSASVFVNPSIEKLFANQWRLGFASDLDLYHDRFTTDRDGNHFFAKAYGFVRTPLGDVEIGQQDGAAYKMAITGPSIAPVVAIDDGTIDFFRDPSSGQNLHTVFDDRTAVFATSNDAKISYYSPRLIGLQIGFSFTPQQVAGVIPFCQTAPKQSGRQDNLIDAAVNYIDSFGATTLALYGGLAHGHHVTGDSGYGDLWDWALGGEIDEDLGSSTLALGGAFRQSNSFSFQTFDAAAQGSTRAAHVSATWTQGPWKAGLEYAHGQADAVLGLPATHFAGYGLNGGYAVSDNLDLTLGYQHQRLARSTPAFYTGGDAITMHAVYLYVAIHG